MSKKAKLGKVVKKFTPAPEKKSSKEEGKKKTGPAIGERANLMYKYPDDCLTLSARKLFRASARKKLQTLRKSLKAIEAGKKEGDAKEAKQLLLKFKGKNFNKAEEKTIASK